MIQLNDSLRRAFLPTGSRCFLLKRVQSSGTRFIVVQELTSGWFIEFNEYRGQFKLLYATLDTAAGDKIAQTSFIAYGVPDADDQLEVFSIDPSRRDVIPPVGTNSQWKVYVDKTNERFTLP